MGADISVFGVFGAFEIFAKVSVFGIFGGPQTLVVGTKVVEHSEKIAKICFKNAEKNQKNVIVLGVFACKY